MSEVVARGGDAPASSGRAGLARVHARLAALVGRPAFWILFVAIIASYPIGRSLWALGRQPPPLPELGVVPEFRLVDQFGRPFGSRELAGKVWVAGFFFTRCPTVCPRLTETMRAVQHRARNLGDAFHLVSFSVDPDHDTPEVLRAYAKERRARTHTWSFLTGPAPEIQRTVVEGLKIAMSDPSPDADPASVLHGTHFVLVDGRGRIRGYYGSEDETAIDRMLADAGRLANRGQ